MTKRCLAILALLSPTLFAAEHTVSSSGDLARLKPAPGDTILLPDGIYKDQHFAFLAKGAAEKPITLRAMNPGKAILTGDSSFTVDGEHLVVSGLYLKNCTAKDGIDLKGAHNRLTDTAVVDCTPKFYVHLFGTDNRVDHCYLAGKTSDSPTLQVEVPAPNPNRHRIDHNHFGPRPPLGRNGGETIRIGYSHQSMNSSGAVVEHNLFDRCDGELEIVSSKSCDNVYRFNTFLECAGMLTLRHGNRCVVDANVFLGRGKKGSGGIRVIGEDHIVTNNYIDGVDKGGVWITAGIPDSPLVGYYVVKNCLIAFNTIVDSKGPCLELDAGFGSSRRSLRPEKVTIANNVFSPGKGGTLLKGTEGQGWTWTGNLSSVPADHAAIKQADLKLARGTDGLLRPTAGSPARGTAAGDFRNVTGDVDGQPRAGKSDAGCDQISDAPATNRPLTAKDTGPSWMDRTAAQ